MSICFVTRSMKHVFRCLKLVTFSFPADSSITQIKQIYCNYSLFNKFAKRRDRSDCNMIASSSPYGELCKRIGLSRLREQRLAKILSTVFKILASDAGPKSLRDLITVRCSTYNLRGTTILDLPKVKSTTFGLRSWRYAASKLWNALPDESRKIQTFTTFKNYLKTLDLTGL